VAYVRLVPLSNATTYPVSVEFARRHSRINQSLSDDLVWFYIASATRQAENHLNRALITRSYSYSVAHTQPPQEWPLVQIPFTFLPLGLDYSITHMERYNLELPYSPVSNVTAVYYSCWDNTTQMQLTLGTDYNVDYFTEPARIHLTANFNISNNNHITAEFVAGYGDNPEDVPIEIRHAILLMVAHNFEFRGDTDTYGIPSAAKQLMSDYRLHTFEAYF